MGNGTMIVTLPNQVFTAKRGPNKPVSGLTMVQPTKEFAKGFATVKKAVSVNSILVTRTLEPARKGGASFFRCSDLIPLKDCPEDIQNNYNEMFKAE